MSSNLEPMIWSHDTGQQIPCFDRCQLTVTRMSNIKEGHYKPRVHLSVNLLAGVWPPSWVTPSPIHHRLYAPTSNTPSHNNHRKINSWVSFSFLYGYGALLGTPQAAGALLILLNKCGFLLRKTFFSHTAGSLGTGLRGGFQVTWLIRCPFFFCHPPLPDMPRPPTHPWSTCRMC